MGVRVVGEPTYDWHSLDWTKRDSELAIEVRISREWIRKIRQRYGFPKHRDVFLKKLALLAKDHTLPEISEKMGISTQTARRWLRELGVSAKPTPPSALAGEPKRDQWKYDWDAVDWSKSNGEIARELGIKSSQVYVFRKRHNKPAPTK